MTTLKRKIVDYKKLTDEILALLVERYPDGYNDNDIITFPNSQGEIIEAVEVCTHDTKYLVKVSKRLVTSMQEYEDSLEDMIPDTSELDDDEELNNMEI